MAKGSDNPFPSVLFVEGTEPTAPAAGRQRLYIDSTTHHLMRTDSSGIEVDIEASSDAVNVTFTPAGNLAATDVQAALEELDDEKVSITRTVNAQTGTSYTLVLGDAGAFVTMTNAAASTLTVPPNSSVAFPVGTFVDGAQLGAGQVTLTPGAGVTINGTPGLKVAAQYGTFGLLKTATDTWLAFGRLSA